MPVPIPSPRHFMTLKDYTSKEIGELLRMSHALKKTVQDNNANFKPLQGKTIGMLFQKRSTRTRVSTETGMFKLGGHSLFLGKEDIQLGVNETIRDTANVLSRFNDMILARVNKHSDITELAKYSSIPVINALSEKYHPLQALADVMTIQQRYRSFPKHPTEDRPLKVAWVGDGNNVTHSLLFACAKLGVNMGIATPKGYECLAEVVADASDMCKESGSEIVYTNDPVEAVKGADFIVTDTWVSMGDEDQTARRLKDFTGYEVTEDLCQNSHPDWRFLHCLPRHKEEVSDQVFYSNRSLVFGEAENRMYTVMAVMMFLSGNTV
eukprot:CFRG2178T1